MGDAVVHWEQYILLPDNFVLLLWKVTLLFGYGPNWLWLNTRHYEFQAMLASTIFRHHKSAFSGMWDTVVVTLTAALTWAPTTVSYAGLADKGTSTISVWVITIAYFVFFVFWEWRYVAAYLRIMWVI